MPTPACAMAGICGCGHFFPSFSLERKGPKVQGRHHRTQHTKRTLPRHVDRGPRAQPSGGLANPHSADYAHAFCRHCGLDPQSPTLYYFRGAEDFLILTQDITILFSQPLNESSARSMSLVGPIHISFIASTGRYTSTYGEINPLLISYFIG